MQTKFFASLKFDFFSSSAQVCFQNTAASLRLSFASSYQRLTLAFIIIQ